MSSDIFFVSFRRLLCCLLLVACVCLYLFLFFFKLSGDHRDLHVLTHSFPTRRSSDLVRSHDHFNTTIYSYSDRYRGVYNDRMVLFMNADDRAERGLAPKARVAVETISGDGVSRRVEGLTVIDYPMPRGSLAGYFPELNPLLPLDHYDPTSGTPAAKAIPVLVTAV